ncbi:hypothetical protein GC169_04705 [bacterium]|nr:hypothetical protein [bacterium]
MFKVIVERPRKGAGWRRKGRTRPLTDDDGAPYRAARPSDVAPRWTPGSKFLNENLAPLRRFIGSRTGRPWNKVHAEIAEHLNPRSTVQQHVLDHLTDIVVINTCVRDGVVIGRSRFGAELPIDQHWADYFVHPKSGLLLRNPASRKSRRARFRRTPDDVAARRRDLGPFRQAHRLRDGAWWDVVLEPVPTATETYRDSANTVRTREVALAVDDVLAASGLLPAPPLPSDRLYGAEGVYAVSMRRFTRAERQRLNLP